MTTTKRSARLNKCAFFEDLGYKPHPGQLEVHNSNALRRVVACGVRWGKSLCAAAEGLAAAMEPKQGSIGWVCAPSYDLAEKVFREIQLFALRNLKHRIVTLKDSDKRIVLRNLAGGTSEIRGKSADNPTSLLGEGLDWLIVDEAARLKPLIWQDHLSQRLIDKKGWALMISTPRGKGWFFECWRRGRPGGDPDFQSWNLPSWTNPHIDAALIERERGRLPERSFLQEYAAEFIEGSGSVFRNVRECATGNFQDPVEEQTYYAGLDLAKTEDFTVIVVLNRSLEVVFADRFNRLDWSVQVGRVKAALDRYNGAPVLVDSTGGGEPVLESLLRADVDAVPYPLSNKTKSQAIDNLALLFERREVVIPRPDVFPEGVDELESFQYSVTDAGTVRSSAPSGMHDDIVIALGLAAWLATRPESVSSVTIF